MLLIILPFLIGIIYFNLFEKFDSSSLSKKCWTVLHYTNKINSPLYLVHFKSIFAGFLLVIAGYYHIFEIPIIIGSAIIGLHIAQAINEFNLIYY